MATLLTATKISGMIKKLARLLTEDQRDRRPILLFILNASYPFASDLSGAMRTPHEVEFIRARSFIKGEQRAVSIQPGACAAQDRLKDRHVVILDTIVETGETIAQVANFVHDQKPKTIMLACLVNKHPTAGRTKIQPAIRYSCWSFYHDDFLVGYGLDYRGFLRGLPGISRLKDHEGAQERIDTWLKNREALLESKRRNRLRNMKFGRVCKPKEEMIK